MSAKLNGALPKGDANGIGPIIGALVNQPHRSHVVVLLVDCKKVSTDHDTGEVIPTARIRHVEAITDHVDKANLRIMLEKARDERCGYLPLEMEEQRTFASAFDLVDPDTGELPPDGDVFHEALLASADELGLDVTIISTADGKTKRSRKATEADK